MTSKNKRKNYSNKDSDIFKEIDRTLKQLNRDFENIDKKIEKSIKDIHNTLGSNKQTPK